MIENRFHTVIPSQQLPSIPDAFGAMALAIQYQLERSQWWPPEVILAQQCKQLENLFQHANNHVPFYQKRLRQAGFKNNCEVTPELVQKIPILKRSELQQAGKAIYTSHYPKAHGKTHLIQTSGSTGQPVSLYGTNLTRLFWQAFTLRDHCWQQRDFNSKLAAIRWTQKGRAMPPEGLQRKGWGDSVDRAFFSGSSIMLNSASDISDQFTWLTKHKPHYLVSHPSNLLALADYFMKQGVQLETLREITTVGEIVTEKIRLACRKAWGVEIKDFYTCQEAGYLALQCPEHEHYHVQSENVYLEVVDDTGNPCNFGEIGRVLITNLNNFASPLIRYELGDYAEVGTSCPCGRGLPVIKRVIGRVRNMLHLPNGGRRWPNFGYKALEAIAPIQQFQVIQHSLEKIELKLVVPKTLNSQQENALRTTLSDNLGHPFTIDITYHKKIQRDLSGKFEDFVSKITAN